MDAEPRAEGRTPAGGSARRFFWPGGLSSRLLILTAAFIAFSGLLILPTLLAAYEAQWLKDRVQAAELASLAVEAAPDRVVTDRMAAQLLDGAGVVQVAVQSDGMRRLLLSAPDIGTPDLIDLRAHNPAAWLAAPFATLTGKPGRMVRVVARPTFRSGDFVEIVAPDGPLKRQMGGYLLRLLAVTAFTSAVAGGLVYLSLNLFLVRPMQRITLAMERFRADPEDQASRIQPSGRRDEIGRAEAELDRMQADLVAALSSRARLAALGEAVAKINHDLRNMLTSAQIASERLAMSGDPSVAKALPRLERALDRAVSLASGVLAYGKTSEAAPVPVSLDLSAAVDAAAEDAGLSEGGVRLDNAVPAASPVSADPDQLHRILVNLLRNAREAIAGVEGRGGRGKVRVELFNERDASVIDIADDGPGVPERAREGLFQPFAGSARAGGTGLGLAIARELAQAHGGDLNLIATGPEGSTFELRLPAAEKPRRARKAAG